MQHAYVVPQPAILYQPIDEIRDYFGDEVAIYFAWMAVFTRALVFPSLFGVIAIISQWMSGGVNDNPLTVPYSIFFSAWSIIFLGTWKRRENELAFLWGSKECELTCMSYHFLRTVHG